MTDTLQPNNSRQATPLLPRQNGAAGPANGAQAVRLAGPGPLNPQRAFMKSSGVGASVFPNRLVPEDTPEETDEVDAEEPDEVNGEAPDEADAERPWEDEAEALDDADETEAEAAPAPGPRVVALPRRPAYSRPEAGVPAPRAGLPLRVPGVMPAPALRTGSGPAGPAERPAPLPGGSGPAAPAAGPGSGAGRADPTPRAAVGTPAPALRTGSGPAGPAERTAPRSTPNGAPARPETGRAAASLDGRPALTGNSRTENGARTPAAAGQGSGRPVLPRMELKPVLPVDSSKPVMNVVPVPRVLAPPPPRPASEPSVPPRPAHPQGPAPRPAPVSAAQAPSQETGAPPDLEGLLEHLVNLPAQTAILGVCDDRLPVLVDLNDPVPGALLVASDDEAMRLRLMKTLLRTAAALNSPRGLQFLILSARPDEWKAWLEGLDALRHCLGVDSLVEGSPERWLLKLSGWVDQRRTGSTSGPAVLLLVDDLAAVPQLEYDARVHFDWLLKEGPAARIWPVVSVSAGRTPELVRWVRLFKTRILGQVQDAALNRQLAASGTEDDEISVQPDQFAVRIQESWLKFRLPGGKI